MKKLALTKPEQKVYDFIAKFIAKKKKSPTYMEIAAGVKRNSGTVWVNVGKMIDKGYVKINPKLNSRNIVLK